jgi:hypothetical protein
MTVAVLAAAGRKLVLMQLEQQAVDSPWCFVWRVDSSARLLNTVLRIASRDA